MMSLLIFNNKTSVGILRLTNSTKFKGKYNFPIQIKIILILILISTSVLNGQTSFTKHFKTGRLRFDYAISSDGVNCRVDPFHYYYEPVWGGSKFNLTDTLNYGEMKLEVYDSSSNRLIYSYGYSTLFQEWLTTDIKHDSDRIFIESILMPYPLQTITLKIYNRDNLLNLKEIYTTYFNPNAIVLESLNQLSESEVKNLKISGDPSEKVDIVFVSEGYTRQSREKFFQDAEKYSKILFEWDPYKKYSNSFNLYAVYYPSEQEGSDLQQDSLWVNTALNTRFYTFGSERYLTTEDMPKVRNILSGIPYDQICIMVNTDKYGGGGIYNFYTVFSAENSVSEFLFHHEFGHAFAGLADEYYTSQTAYVNMFEKNVEPSEPNITTLTSFDNKWKYMISDTVQIPTPATDNYKNIIGVYEGAGYCEKGIYRSYVDCSMKSKINNAFCPVCKRAIERMILLNDPSAAKNK
jgi:hypothetical protein